MNRIEEIVEMLKLRNELSLYQIVQVIEDLYFNEQTFQVSFDKRCPDGKEMDDYNITFNILTNDGFKNFYKLEEVREYLEEI
jgi:hypothetical protein